MKKIILFALFAFAGWSYFNKNTHQIQNDLLGTVDTIKSNSTTISDSVESFTCDGRQHCSQMNSRAEAEYFIKHCPNTKMDGDNDGIPCENDSRF
ncbi:excalibur calcium-binding domain-containing protein [Plesiomonas shigelloides]|uniref:excalibur calcium-binding domain-containing protein n=1 Tax=Plesiomonas shigelloides TaxID=703 RepID=UPI001E42A995|nr:excalibur calcium-binding domain-containing protein [Plesiomonas shigelloides]